jgi:signal transduction histidine kinase
MNLDSQLAATTQSTASPLRFERVSFSRQFLAACAAILIVGMATLGHWLGRQIETSAVNRTAAIAAVYVESILSTELREWKGADELDQATSAVLDQLFIHGPLHRKVLRFKLWDKGGKIAYSSDSVQLGLRFPIDKELSAAFNGQVQAKVSDLDDADNQREHLRWPRLLEVYVPVRVGSNAEIVGVAEFYHSTENLGQDIFEAQRKSWLLVATSTMCIYLLLYGLVRRADNLIIRQQGDLQQQLVHLRALLGENNQMRERLSEAGVRTTTLNEQFLHRVAADIHDGPAQTIALAKMRFDELTATPEEVSPEDRAQNMATVHGALHTSLQQLRNIAFGLAIPGIADLTLGDTVYRAIRDFERTYGMAPTVQLDGEFDEPALAVKITLYRVLQESLTNSWRHARPAVPHVTVRVCAGRVLAEISDTGPGFDPAATTARQLGLAFMRERVRLLGGVCTINSTPGHGAQVRVDLPLTIEATIHD